MADALRAGLNLMRRLPPRDVDTNLSGLCALCPSASDAFLQRIDRPLGTRVCAASGRRYILCDYNRDGDSYRSPWSNVYEPALPDGFLPSEGIRALEVAANEVFDVYREQYYDATHSVSSVYFWDLEEGFAGCFLIKKEIGSGRYIKKGSWDAIHVIEAAPSKTSPGKTAYKLTTTVLLTLCVDAPSAEGVGTVDLSGSVTRQATATLPTPPAAAAHIANMGSMVEQMEGDMRASLDALYIAKTREIVSTLRHKTSAAAMTSRAFVSDLASAVSKHGKK